MLLERYGDVLTTEQVIVAHGANARGRMGAGLALQIALRYPVCVVDLAHAARCGHLALGNVVISRIDASRIVCHVVSQPDTSRSASREAIAAGLLRVLWFARDEDLGGFAAPLIGTGLGGLCVQESYDALRDVAMLTRRCVELWRL